jgi:hypothetical protein
VLYRKTGRDVTGCKEQRRNRFVDGSVRLPTVDMYRKINILGAF